MENKHLQQGDQILLPNGEIGSLLFQAENHLVVGQWTDDPFLPLLTSVSAFEVNKCKILYDLSKRLKGVPEHTVLYTPLCGEAKFSQVRDDGVILVFTENSQGVRFFEFDKYGRVSEGGEVLLFPSKDEHDWGSWKKVKNRPTGNRYWFVSSRYNVCEDVDDKSTRDTNRFEIGNYFNSKEKAEVARDRILQVFKDLED